MVEEIWIVMCPKGDFYGAYESPEACLRWAQRWTLDCDGPAGEVVLSLVKIRPPDSLPAPTDVHQYNIIDALTGKVEYECHRSEFHRGFPPGDGDSPPEPVPQESDALSFQK